MKEATATKKQPVSGERGGAEASIFPDILTILDALPFYVMLIDAAHNIVLANKKVKTDLNLEPEQLIGHYCPQVVHGVDHYPGCPLDESLKTGKAVEKEIYDEKQGRWLRSAIYPTELKTADGLAVYFHLVQDIDQRKKTQMELEKHREHLEELVEQRTAEVLKSNEKLQAEIGRCKGMESTVKEGYRKERKLRQVLEEQIKRRADFTRALIHELKTPLTPVLAASDVLVAKLTWEPWKSLARNINMGAHDLNRRTDELFDVARGETGILSLEKHSVETYQLLRDVVDYVTPEATRLGLAVKLKATPRLARVWADEDRLRQMMLLLIDNALKFTRRGGEVNIGARKRGGFLAIEVQDTGSGIIKEEQKWLFEPYHRPRRDGEHLGGLGLGLTLLKMLAELHGGKVWVRSQSCKGSTFGFSVPLDDGRKDDGNTR